MKKKVENIQKNKSKNKRTHIEYLNLLNNEIKEKLIGLCINRIIQDDFKNDSSTDEKETIRKNAFDDYDNEEKEEVDK